MRITTESLVEIIQAVLEFLANKQINKQEEYYILYTRPSMEISPKTHLHELSTMIHVVRKQIKCILVNERPRDISLGRLRDLICCVYMSVNACQSLITFFRDKETHSAFSNNI